MLRQDRSDDPFARELRLCAVRPPTLADVARLADHALGASLRARTGRERVLPTMTLTVELDPAPLPAAVGVRAWSEPVSDGIGRAHGAVLHGETVVGHALATFAVPRSAPPAAPLPWELSSPSGATSGGDLPAEAALAPACRRDGDRTTLRPDGAMLNRSGRVQGAVLFRLAAVSASDHAGDEDVLVSGQMQFLDAALPGTPLVAHPDVLRTSGKTRFVRTDVRQDDRHVAAASFVLRRRRP